MLDRRSRSTLAKYDIFFKSRRCRNFEQEVLLRDLASARRRGSETQSRTKRPSSPSAADYARRILQDLGRRTLDFVVRWNLRTPSARKLHDWVTICFKTTPRKRRYGRCRLREPLRHDLSARASPRSAPCSRETATTARTRPRAPARTCSAPISQRRCCEEPGPVCDFILQTALDPPHRSHLMTRLKITLAGCAGAPVAQINDTQV